MNKAEFDAWQEHTDRSAARWIVDPIHDGRGGRDLLAHKGGEAGHYIMVMPDGKVHIGSYEGAIPHIGEAAFRIEHTQQCKDFNDGVSRVFSALGLNFLIEYLLM